MRWKKFTRCCSKFIPETTYQISSKSPERYRSYYKNNLVFFFPDTLYRKTMACRCTRSATYIFHPGLVVKTTVQHITIWHSAVCCRLQLCHLVVNHTTCTNAHNKTFQYHMLFNGYLHKKWSNTIRTMTLEQEDGMGQLPKICVRIGILMHRIFNFYFVGAFF